MYSSLRQTWKIVMLALLSLFVISCGGGGGGGGGSSKGSSGGGGSSDDWVKLKIDSGTETTYTEAFSAAIACDPRVDWASNQVVLYENYTGSGPAAGFEMFLDIMFGISDAVGTYDVAVSGDGLNVLLMDSSGTYQANFATAGSSGTVTVTRSDARIEGTYIITAVDAGSNTITLSGSFGVDNGNSLSCP